MKLNQLIIFTAGILASTAHATIIYEISDGTTTTTVAPIAKAESASDYYDYAFEGPSGNPDFGPVDDKAFFWLYEDTGTGVLSLGMIFEKRNAAGGGTGGSMNLTTSGMPGSTTVSVSDDGPETGDLINGTETWGWNDKNTDGAMVSGLENQTWDIALTFNSYTGLGSGFAFVDGPSPTGTAIIDGLDLPSGSGVLHIRAIEVPAPATGILFILGLAGLTFGKRRS